MPIITLTTDFGEKDHFAGAVKGAIYAEFPEAKIVDITHSVTPFHITEASYIIKNAYKKFPEGSIHIIGVDAELTPENKHIALKLDGHYFVCANNGIMSLIASEYVAEKIVEINIHEKPKSNFPVLDVFVKVAGHLARGGTLEVIGKVISEIRQIREVEPFFNAEGNQIKGNVLYIDNYGNVVTNITRKMFEKIGKGRKFVMRARTASFTEIYETYSDAVNFAAEEPTREDGKKLAIFNSGGYIELAIYKSNPSSVGSASSLFGLEWRDTVTITFE